MLKRRQARSHGLLQENDVNVVPFITHALTIGGVHYVDLEGDELILLPLLLSLLPLLSALLQLIVVEGDELLLLPLLLSRLPLLLSLLPLSALLQLLQLSPLPLLLPLLLPDLDENVREKPLPSIVPAPVVILKMI